MAMTADPRRGARNHHGRSHCIPWKMVVRVMTTAACDREDCMTKDQAIETCAKALVRSRNYPESTWQTSGGRPKDFAVDLVTLPRGARPLAEDDFRMTSLVLKHGKLSRWSGQWRASSSGASTKTHQPVRRQTCDGFGRSP